MRDCVHVCARVCVCVRDCARARVSAPVSVCVCYSVKLPKSIVFFFSQDMETIMFKSQIEYVCTFPPGR